MNRPNDTTPWLVRTGGLQKSHVLLVEAKT